MTEQRKRTVTIITIATSMLSPLLILAWPTFPGAAAQLLYIAALIGYMGIILLLWMYILGTRAVTGLIFTDIAPVLAIHKWLGRFAVPMIFLHPMLIAFSYGGNLLQNMIPRFSTPTEQHIFFGQVAFSLLLLTWTTSALLRSKMKFRPWKYLHYLAYLCVPFALLHVPDLGSQQQSSSLVNGLYTLLVGVFVLFTLIRARSLFNIDKARYIIESIEFPTSEDAVITVQPVGKPLRSSRPGQFIYVKQGLISEDHPFSALLHNEDTSALTLGVRNTGPYTQQLHTLKPDTVLYLSGPYGSFTSDIHESELAPVFIAGGIGITPFMRYLTESNEAQLFYANRSKTTSLLYAELRTRLGDNLYAFFGQRKDATESNEYPGRVTADHIQRNVTSLADRHFYVCGPVGMLKATTDDLASLGVPKAHIHIEEFGW